MIGIFLLITLLALTISAWYLWTYKKDETISFVDKCKKKVNDFKNWLEGGVKKHKKKAIAIGLGATAVSGGMMMTGSEFFGFDAMIIDSMEDYKLVGINPNHIINPVLYEKQVLCEGHIPLIINLTDNSNMTLKDGDITNLITLEKIDNTLGNINTSIRILQPFKKKFVNPIYTTEQEKVIVTNNKTFTKEYEINNITKFSHYENYTETWYKWVDIEDIDELILQTNDLLVIDIVGNWKADKIGKVDIVPTVSINKVSNRYSEYAWWNSNWLYKKEITINHNLVDGNMADFPVLINITDTDLRDYAQSNGDDIAFVDSTETTQFNHEIEYWDNTTGKLVAWVNVTSLSSSSDTSIYMYYGNDDCGNQEDITNVWESNYQGVWHFKEGSGTNVSDSTSNNRDGTLAQSDHWVSHNIGYAYDFDGNDDECEMSWNPQFGSDSLMLMSYAYCDLSSGGVYTIAGVAEYSIGQEEFVHFMNGGEIHYQSRDIDNDYAQSNYATDYNNPFYIVASLNRSTSKQVFYVNGIVRDVDSTSSVGTLNTDDHFGIGQAFGNNGGDDEFDGIIDEVRIYQGLVNASYITTNYNTMNNATDGDFFSMGAHTSLWIQNPYPSDKSTGQTIKPKCHVDVSEPDGNTMDITFSSNYSGSWVNYQTNSSVTNGTYYWDFTGADSCLTKYWWKVYADNGTTNLSREMEFTTGICPSVQEIVYPNNNSVWIDLSPTCIINVTANSYFNDVDVVFSSNYSGSWVNYQTNNSISLDSLVYWDFTGVSSGTTKYWWRVEVSNGTYSNTYTYTFTTEEDVNDWQYYKELTVCDANNSNYAYLDVGNSSGGDVHCEGNVYNDFGDLRFYNHNASENVTFEINSITENTSCNVTIILPDDIETYDTIRMYYGKIGSQVETISNEDVNNEYIYTFRDTFSDGSYDGWEYDGLNCTQNDILFTGSTDDCNDDRGGSCPQDAYYDYSLVLVEENYFELNDTSFLNNDTDYELKLAIHAKSMDDSGENARVIMWDGTSWNEIVQEHGNDDTWAYKTATISSSDIGENTRLKLEIEGSNGCVDYTYFDNITIRQVTNRPYFCAFGEQVNTKGPNTVDDSESPSDGTLGVDLNTDLGIEIYHPLGLFNTIHYMTNATGSWQEITSTSGIVNGSSQVSTSGYFTSYDTNYYWSVNISDSANAWYNETFQFTTEYDISEYAYSEVITIDSTYVDDDLSDFVIPVKINGTISKYCDDGDSILFTNMDGGRFEHEVEYFSSTSPTYCHVRIPSSETITSDTNYQFKLYFNNSNAVNIENATAVWENYDMVYHFSESSGNIIDWTGNGYDAVPKNSPIYRAGGTWGYAMDFNGTNEYCAITNKSYSTTDISDMLIFTLIRSEASSGGDNRRIFSFDRSEYYCVLLDSSSEYPIWTTEADDMTGDVSITENTWKSITGVFDSGDRYLYIDDSQNKADSFGTSTFGTGTTRYGFIAEGSEASSYDGSKNSEYFPGKIDEILVRESIPDYLDAWVKLKYNAYTNPNTLSGVDEDWGDPVIVNTSLDGQSCVEYEPDLTVEVSDPDGEKMDVYIYTNTTADDVWTNIATVADVNDGSYNIVDITTLWDTSDTKYWYAVNVTDETGNYENTTYSFTTADNPTIDTFSPSNDSTNICFKPILWINITSTCDEDARVRIYDNSTGSWSLIDTSSNVNNGESVSHIFDEAIEINTKYWWKVIIDVGFTDTNEYIYHFTTSDTPTMNTYSPANESSNIDYRPTLWVNLTDTCGNDNTVRIYENSTGDWILIDTTENVNDGESVSHVMTEADSASTTYWWKVQLDNGYGSYNEYIYHFTTTIAPTIDVQYPTHQSTDIEKAPTVSVWTNESDGRDLNVYFYRWTGSSYSLEQTNSSVSDGTLVEWVYDQAINSNTLYKWRVNAIALEDGVECGETRLLKEFTTAQAPVIDDYVPTDGTWYWSDEPDYFNVTVSDPLGHNMDVNLYVTNFDGNIFNTSSSVTNGTVSHTNNSWVTSFGHIDWAISVNNSKGFYTNDSTPYFYRGRDASASFTYTNLPVTNTPVSFTDASTNATSWDWDLGDGTTSTNQNTNNNYTYMGSYTINLTINDGDTYWKTAYSETTIHIGYNQSISSGTDYFIWMGNTTNISGVKENISTSNEIYYWDGTTWNNTGNLTIPTFSVLKKNNSWSTAFRTPCNRSVTYSDAINYSLVDGYNYIVWHLPSSTNTKSISTEIPQSTPEFVSFWDGTDWNNYIATISPDSYSKTVGQYDIILIAMDDDSHWYEVN
jgi:hypothetical protein